MRALFICLGLLVACLDLRAGPGDDRAKQLLQSDNYSVTWGTAPTFESGAALEIGDGSGHGGSLGWIWFQPVAGGVEVLSFQLDEGRIPHRSKWPPDRASVAVKRARMSPDAYAALLHDLATVASANLNPVARNGGSGSSNDFWVNARLATDKETFFDLNWAGYEGSSDELEFAKPRAVVRLSREAIRGLHFKEHTLTAGERAWESAKFTRDWKKFRKLDFHWWVRERYIEAVGLVGNEAALPVLREILEADPPQDKPREPSDARSVYYAINAVTRLAKQDAREQPVEEMNIEETRLKVLKLIEGER